MRATTDYSENAQECKGIVRARSAANSAQFGAKIADFSTNQRAGTHTGAHTGTHTGTRRRTQARRKARPKPFWG
ncbi:MAG: hypothetical protein QXT00_02680 [Ignisphaera sp.]